MSDPRPARELDKVIVRLPDGLRGRLNSVARDNGRSANAEVVKALEAWLADDLQSEPAFVRLPERLRERVTAAAHLNRRSVFREIVARLADSFGPVAQPPADGEPPDLRSLIRDAMHEVVDGLIGDPEKLKRLGARARQGKGEPESG